MAIPPAINKNGFTVLYEAPQPAVEYVLFHTRCYVRFCTRYGVYNNDYVLTWPSQPCLRPRIYWTSQRHLDVQGQCAVKESSKETRTRRRRAERHSQTLQNPEAAAVQSKPISRLLHRVIDPRIQPHADGGGYKGQKQSRARRRTAARCVLAG